MGGILLSTLQIDPSYAPPSIETKQVYGVHLQQKRNEWKIDESLFQNIVSKNKEASYIFISLLTTIIDMIFFLAPSLSCGGPHRRDARTQIHAIKQRRLRLSWRYHWHRRRATIAYPLYPSRRWQS